MEMKDIIHLAKEAGLIDPSEFLMPHPNQLAAIARFAKTIESETLENAAKVCDRLGGDIDMNNVDDVKIAANSLADAIRRLQAEKI